MYNDASRLLADDRIQRLEFYRSDRVPTAVVFDLEKLKYWRRKKKPKYKHGRRWFRPENFIPPSRFAIKLERYVPR